MNKFTKSLLNFDKLQNPNDKLEKGRLRSAEVRHSKAIEAAAREFLARKEYEAKTPEFDRYRRPLVFIEFRIKEVEDLILAIDNRIALIGKNAKLINLKEKLQNKLKEINAQSILTPKDEEPEDEEEKDPDELEIEME